MKFGVTFPQHAFTDPLALRDFAQAAEELGYDYLLTYDHVVGANPDRPDWQERNPYTYKHLFHEPFVLYGYLAGLTERIEFVTGILILPQRQTALVAKQSAQVDLLSNGRLRLGVGVGWNHVEYETLGQDFSTRGRRMEEQVTLLRQLWTQELVNYEGEFDTLPDVGINPLPVQQPIPIWMGGYAEVVLRRMARMADGWFMAAWQPDEAKTHIDKLKGYLQDEGRDPVQFGFDIRIQTGRIPQDEWGTLIEQYESAGLTDLAIYPHGETLDDFLGVLRDFREAMP